MPAKVLIIDDEADTCQMLSLGLQIFGYQTDYALSGKEGLAKVRDNQPNLLVLDLMLPDTDGFEIIRHLRADPATAALPIIILSAMAHPGAEDKCFKLGATAFMRKPIGIRELGEAVKQHI
jgi:two-component system sensor histidine kinase/response regulator